MLVEHDELSRWGQLSTCKWWKMWFCCASEQNNLWEADTHYDSYDLRGVDGEKDGRIFINNTIDNMNNHQYGDANNEKDEIIFLA